MLAKHYIVELYCILHVCLLCDFNEYMTVTLIANNFITDTVALACS